MNEFNRYILQTSNNNNFNEKVFYLPSDDKSFIKKTHNPFAEKQEKEENKYFPYLVKVGNSVIFKKEGRDLENLYNTLKGKIRYVVCILMENDSFNNSDILKRTLRSITNNITSFKEIHLEPKNILVCIFFKEIKGREIFNRRDYLNLRDFNDYILVKKKYIYEEKTNKSIKVHCISKIDYFSEVEILKCFYCMIIKQLKLKEGIIFTSVVTAGLEINYYSLQILLLLSFNSKASHKIIVPLIDDCDNDNFIYKIKRYERIHYNIYNLNFYDMTQSIPISSLFNVMTIDDKLFRDLNIYYANAYLNQSVDCHDYNLSLFLSRNGHNIVYYNENCMGELYLINYYSDLPISDYKDTWIKRYSGYYANFFELIRVLIDCNNFNIFKKVFLFFQIIGCIVDFIFPSLSTIIIYTVFYEAFNIYDSKPSIFCTLLYLFFFLCSGTCSLVSINSEKMLLTNIIFYIFMEIYYLFILICSIIAINNVRINNNSDPYRFNSLAISLIIVLIFIPSIIPLIIKNSLIIENIIPTLLYFSLGASQSTSTYMFPKILNSCEACGGGKTKERKGIVILAYFSLNLLIGCLSFFNYTRKKRVETIMILGICFLVYNFFKMTAIVINLIINSNKFVYKSNAEEEIKKEFQRYDNMKLSSVTMASELNNGITADLSGVGSINPSINQFGNLENQNISHD